MSDDIQFLGIKKRRTHQDQVQILGVTIRNSIQEDEQMARQLQQEWDLEQRRWETRREIPWERTLAEPTYEELLALSERIGPAISPSLPCTIYTHFPTTKTKQECDFCISEYRMGMRLPCTHVFHKKCIIKWFKNSKYCPM
jgi:hypothetical protein